MDGVCVCVCVCVCVRQRERERERERVSERERESMPVATMGVTRNEHAAKGFPHSTQLCCS
jgi:hypothetical protein